MHAKQEKGRLLSVFFVFFVDNFGYALVFPLLAPLLFNSSYHMVDPSVSIADRNLLIGLLYAAFPLGQFLGAPFIGDLADHYGRKKGFLVTLSGGVIGYLLSALAILIHSFPLLVFSRLINGLCAANLSICLATIADVSSSERIRGNLYGQIASVAGISWIASIVVSSYFSDPKIYHLFNPSLPFLISGLLAIINLGMISYYFEETRGIQEKKLRFHFMLGIRNILTAFKIKEIRSLFLIYFLLVIGWGAVLSWFVPIAIERFNVPQEDAGWGLILFGLSWSIGGVLLNYLLLRKTKTQVIVTSALLGLSSLIVLSTFLAHFEYFMLVFILAGAVSSVIIANMINIISLSSPYHMQGKIMGLSQSVISLAWFVGPLVAGLAAKFYILDAYFLAAALLLAALMLFMFYSRKHFHSGKLG
jgi:DHA1 family tetracycline resistance protein-like MFS transporter